MAQSMSVPMHMQWFDSLCMCAHALPILKFAKVQWQHMMTTNKS